MADWMRWEAQDPMLVLQSKQERQQRKGMSQARRKAEDLFRRDDDMGRKLELPGRVSAALFQWGEWANRPNFWVDLRITPFCKLVGMGGHRTAPTVRLDPQSQQVHRAFHRLQCDKTKAVLFAHYVMNVTWSDKPELFDRIGVSKPSYYRLLKTGSLMVYNASQSSISSEK